EVQVAEQVAVGFGDVGVCRDDLARDDQDMDRRLRVDVVKGQATVVLVDDLRGNLAVDYFLKDIILEHAVLLSSRGESDHCCQDTGWRPLGQQAAREEPPMAWIIGIDEAGYGPNLGPFVMTAVACRVPEALSEADLWHILRAAVRRHPSTDDGRLLVEDS